MTVRELVLALARTEEELRGLRDPARVRAPREDQAERRVETLDRLREVDDVDAVALREDVRLHLRVPAPGLVAEVDAGL